MTFKDVGDTVRIVGGLVTVDLPTLIAFGKQRGEDTGRLETIQAEAVSVLQSREEHIGLIADSLKRRRNA